MSSARLSGWLASLVSALPASFVAAAALSTYSAGRFWGGVGPVIPLGIITYLALPPARDFATSGLEWGLSLLWIAMVCLRLAREPVESGEPWREVPPRRWQRAA